VRADGGRSKKLRVAFHFQFSNPAGWRCDECRKSGLETKRRCGRMPAALATPPRVVWARAGVATNECPKSYVSGASRAWLEEFQAWKRLGYPDPRTLSAREVQAMTILERELLSEVKRGQR
jgi:hypothetical protein